MSDPDDKEPVALLVRVLLDIADDILRHELVAVHLVLAPVLALLDLAPGPLHIDQYNAQPLLRC